MVESIFRPLGQSGEMLNPDELGAETYFEMIEDSAVRSGLSIIINSVVSPGFRIEGGDEQAREYIKGMYAQLPMQRVLERILSAFWMGYSVTEKVFNQHEDGNWFIEKYKTLPPDTITFDVAPNGRLRKVLQNSHGIGRANLLRTNFDQVVVFSPRKVVVFTYDGGMSENFGNLHGVSALRGGYVEWFAKQHVIRYLQQFLEVSAGGFILANSGSLPPEPFHAVVSDARSGAVLTFQGEAGQEIKMEFPDSDGDAYLNALVYYDKRVRESLVAPVLLTGQEGPFGSGGLGKEQFKVFRQVRVEPLQNQISELMDADIRQIVDINFGRQDEYPRFIFNVATMEELEARSRYLLNLSKVQALGDLDVPDMRRFVEWVRADEPRGDPLVDAPSTLKGPSPGSSGSAGDGVMRDQTAIDRQGADTDDAAT